MIYLYECKNCNKEFTINKPMSESSKEERCKLCGKILDRKYTASGIKTSDGYKS